MNLSHLYYFRKLAELQHYTQAAQDLHITQPSLSGAIATLEDELGISLFQKRGRNVFLTKYGQEFYDYVCAALRELERGVSIAKEHAGEMGGNIDMGCISTIQGDYLPQLIQKFIAHRGSQVKFHIHQAQTNAIIASVKDGQWDVGFCTPVEDEPDLFFVPILTQPLIAVVSKRHPLAKMPTLTFPDLMKYRLITYHTEQPIGRSIKGLLESHALAADHSYSDEVTLCGVAAISEVVAIVVQTPSLKEFSDIVVIPLHEVPADFRIVHMVFNCKRYKTHAVESFIDYVTAFHSYVPPRPAGRKKSAPKAVPPAPAP